MSNCSSCIVWLIFVFSFLGGNQFVDASDKPNVLFISVDDLNDWISPLGGHPQAQTPHIDRLLKRGVLFTNCHCAAPACNPSRVALMTGLHPSETGIYLNPQPWRPVLPDAVTIPQYFRQHGYHALGSGKIYHGSYPDPASWDEYAPSKSKQTFSDLYSHPKNVNGLNKSHFDWSPIDASVTETADAQTVEYVIEQLGKSWEEPFFLACGIYRPHLPWYAPREFFEKFPLDQVQLPETLATDLQDVPKTGVKMARPQGDHAAVVGADQWKQAVQGYLASIAFTDHLIGRVLDAYDRSPEKENTIIVFWTDHGWHLGEKEHWRKFALWEESTRVPMAIVLPDSKQAGTRCEVPVNLIDIYPTIVEACELPAREGLSGQSLMRLLENPKQTWNRASVTTHGRKNHAVRTQRWRYIRYADGSEELYDHENDPQEYKNLAGDSKFASVIKEHTKWLPIADAPSAPLEKKKKSKQPAQAKQ